MGVGAPKVCKVVIIFPTPMGLVARSELFGVNADYAGHLLSPQRMLVLNFTGE